MFLVVSYVCLNVNPYKSVYNYCTKINGSIKNYVHHGKTQTLKEVGGGYIFVKDLGCLRTTVD